MPRRLDHLEALQEASAAGMRAVLFKDHYYTATPVAHGGRTALPARSATVIPC